MMRIFGILTAIVILLGAPVAMAAEGFVVESEQGQPEIGVPLSADTPITIAQGGHIVIMTQTGQMIRKDGPFDGMAAEVLGGGGGGDPMDGGLLESLLELAEVSGKSTEQLGAVRGTSREGADAPANTITTSVSAYCMKPGDVPQFFTADAPAVDEPLIVRRRVRPIQFLQTTWPAGASTLKWADDWPPPEEGRYIWALGSRGTVGLRIIEVEDAPASPLEEAAMQFDLGCEAQARAAFKAALNQTTQ